MTRQSKPRQQAFPDKCLECSRPSGDESHQPLSRPNHPLECLGSRLRPKFEEWTKVTRSLGEDQDGDIGVREIQERVERRARVIPQVQPNGTKNLEGVCRTQGPHHKWLGLHRLKPSPPASGVRSSDNVGRQPDPRTRTQPIQYLGHRGPCAY